MRKKKKLRNLKKHSFGKLAQKALRARMSKREHSPATPKLPHEAPELAPAPATPELAPVGEELEEIWPAAGVRVAVGIESPEHFLRVGESGVSEGPAPDDAHEVIVKLDSVAVLSSMRIPRSLLVSVGVAMRKMRMWDKCTESVKRDLLYKVGVRDPRDEVLPRTTSVTLTSWGEYVPIGLSLGEECKFKFVPPAFAKAFEDGVEMMRKVGAGELTLSFDTIEDQAHRQDVRQKLLSDWWSQNEVLLVCLCDEASASAALLVVRKTPISVRYYEAGAEGREAL